MGKINFRRNVALKWNDYAAALLFVVICCLVSPVAAAVVLLVEWACAHVE